MVSETKGISMKTFPPETEGEGSEPQPSQGCYLHEPSLVGNQLYKKCVQDYRKPIQGKLEEQRPQRQALDDRGLQSQSSRHILAHFKKPPALAALPGDNKNPDGMAALLDSHRRVAL